MRLLSIVSITDLVMAFFEHYKTPKFATEDIFHYKPATLEKPERKGDWVGKETSNSPKQPRYREKW